MKKLLSVLPVLQAAVLSAADPFPQLNDLGDALFPRGADVKVDADGNYVVNGKIRYLFGAQLDIKWGGRKHTPGYGKELNWLYEDAPSYENLQRAGLDTFALFISSNPWLARFDREAASKRRFGETARDRIYSRPFYSSGLPVLIDYTCFPWTFGLLTVPPYRDHVKEEVFNAYNMKEGNHWVPYNIFHPEGKKLYFSYWEQGIEDMKKHPGIRKLVYELFNEPAYNDLSDYNRKRFALFLKKQYGTIAGLNKIWRTKYRSFEEVSKFKRIHECGGLYVDWSKFMEGGMTSLAKEGAELVRKKTENSLVCYQMLGGDNYRNLSLGHVNMYEIAKYMTSISTPTCGGLTVETGITSAPELTVESPSGAALAEGFLQRKFFLTLAEGKPMHNPECYAVHTNQGNRNVVWQDLLRGSNATYIFYWCKRAWDWKPAGTAQGGRANGEKFSYNILNPYNFTPEMLKGFVDAKQEICRFGDLFMARNKSIAPEIGLLLSFPTERLAPVTGNVVKNEILNYAAALELSAFAWRSVLEEQLFETGKLKAIVAAGVRNTLPGTLEKIEKYVRNGGILIAARDVLEEDEYGNKLENPLFEGLKLRKLSSSPLAELVFADGLPRTKDLPGRIMVSNVLKVTSRAKWQLLASVGKDPAVLKRSFGKGTIYFITPRMQDYAAAAVIKSILAQHKIKPVLEITRFKEKDMAVNIECHPVVRNGVFYAHLMNLDNYPKRIEVKLPAGKKFAANLLSNELLPVREGKAELYLGTNAYAVFASAKNVGELETFCKLKRVSSGELEKRFRADELACRELLKKKNANVFSYHTDALTTPIDLRPFVNMGFVDDVAGDGRGGWTDEGPENSLYNTPWEVTPLLGVPCDFIRFDLNNDKTCIVLRSTSMRAKMPESVKNIPVNAKVRNLYFFHTAAWCIPGKVMDYVIRYASGKTVTLPVRFGEEIGNWWVRNSVFPSCRAAWTNSERKGFYVYDWHNPEPEDSVLSIDIVSACGKTIPIVIGITAERIAPSVHEISVNEWKIEPWGRVKTENTHHKIQVFISEKTKAWSGFSFHAKTPVPLTEKQLENAILKFEINGGTDLFGSYHGGQKLQMTLTLDKRPVSVKVVPPVPDDRKEAFELVEIPLRRFFDRRKPSAFDRIGFQFYGQVHSGIELRNLRIEYRDDAENVCGNGNAGTPDPKQDQMTGERKNRKLLFANPKNQKVLK